MKRTFGRNLSLFLLLILFTLCMAVGCTKFTANTISDNNNQLEETVEPNTESSVSFKLGQEFITGNAGDDVDLTITVKMKNDSGDPKWGSVDFFIKSEQADNLELATDAFGGEGYEVVGSFGNIDRYSSDLTATTGSADESKGFLRFQLSAKKDSNALSAKEDLVINIKFKLINAVQSSESNNPKITFTMDSANYNKIATYDGSAEYAGPTLDITEANVTASIIGQNADTSLETLELVDKDENRLNSWDTTTALADYTSEKANKDNTFIHVKAKQEGALVKVKLDGIEVNADATNKFHERKEKLALSKGSHVVRIEVTAPNGSATESYTFNIKQTYVGLDDLNVEVDGTTVNATKTGLDKDTPVEPERYSYNIFVPYGTGGAEQIVITPTIIEGYGIASNIRVVNNINCTVSTSNFSSGSPFSVQTSSMGALTDNSSLKLQLTNSAGVNKEIEIKFIKYSTDAGYSDMSMVGKDKDNNDVSIKADNGFFYLPKSVNYQALLKFELNQTGSTAKLTKLEDPSVEYDIENDFLSAGDYKLTITAPAGNTSEKIISVRNEAITGAIVNFEYDITSGNLEDASWNNIFDWEGNVIDADKYDAVAKKFTMEMPIGTEQFRFRLSVTDNSTVTRDVEGTTLKGDLVPKGQINNYDTHIFTLTNLSIGINKAQISVRTSTGMTTYKIEIILVEENFGITDIDLREDGKNQDGSDKEALIKNFDPDKEGGYDIEVLFATAELNLTILAKGASTEVYMDNVLLQRKVNEDQTTSTHTGVVRLRSGMTTTIKITFKGTDGYKDGDKTYIINIKRNAADDRNTLDDLQVILTKGTDEGKTQSGNLIQNFKQDVTLYEIVLLEGNEFRQFDQIEIIATATSKVATVYGAGIRNISSSSFEKTLELTVNVQPENSKQGFGMKTYTILITIEPLKFNTDNNVYGVEIFGSDGANYVTGVNEFNQSKITYNITVPYSVDAFSVSVKTNHLATYELIGTPINNDNLNDNNMYKLAPGNNQFTVQAVSQQEQTGPDRKGQIYTFNITRTSALTNANLSDLKVKDSIGNNYIKNFSSTTYVYEAKLGNSNNTNKISIEAIANEASANISLIFNDEEIAPINARGKLVFDNLAIECGETKVFTIKVVVDGTEKLYPLTIVREPSVPVLDTLEVISDGITMDLLDKDGNEISFDPNVTDYYVELLFNRVNFQIKVTAGSGISIEGDAGIKYVNTEFGVDTAGALSYQFVVKKGLTNTYTIHVTRLPGQNSNVDIKSISIDEIAAFAADFSNDKNLYGVYEVNNTISSLNIKVALENTDNTDGVKVLINGTDANELKTGINNIQIIVTSSDKLFERIVTFQVKRKVPSIMSMTATDNDGGAIDPKISFVDNKDFYNMTVANNVSTLNLKFNLSDGYSVSKITGNDNLAEGNNTVTVEIVNSKNEVVRTIELNVYRENAVSYTIWYIVAGVLGALVLLLLILAIIGFAKGGRGGGKRGTINDIGIGDYELD